jgi:hypothetical protein
VPFPVQRLSKFAKGVVSWMGTGPEMNSRETLKWQALSR